MENRVGRFSEKTTRRVEAMESRAKLSFADYQSA